MLFYKFTNDFIAVQIMTNSLYINAEFYEMFILQYFLLKCFYFVLLNFATKTITLLKKENIVYLSEVPFTLLLLNYSDKAPVIEFLCTKIMPLFSCEIHQGLYIFRILACLLSIVNSC